MRPARTHPAITRSDLIRATLATPIAASSGCFAGPNRPILFASQPPQERRSGATGDSLLPEAEAELADPTGLGRRLEELRDRRKILARKVGRGDDFEAEDLFDTTERKWRRVEVKLDEARAEASKPLNMARMRNVDRLIETIEETYYELEQLLD